MACPFALGGKADQDVAQQRAEGRARSASTRTVGTNSQQQSGSLAAEQRPHKAKAGGSCPPRTTRSTNRTGGVP
jgi:hypothetical protein